MDDKDEAVREKTTICNSLNLGLDSRIQLLCRDTVFLFCLDFQIYFPFINQRNATCERLMVKTCFLTSHDKVTITRWSEGLMFFFFFSNFSKTAMENSHCYFLKPTLNIKTPFILYSISSNNKGKRNRIKTSKIVLVTKYISLQIAIQVLHCEFK